MRHFGESTPALEYNTPVSVCFRNGEVKDGVLDDFDFEAKHEGYLSEITGYRLRIVHENINCITSMLAGFNAAERIEQAKTAVKDFLADNLGQATAQPTQYTKEQQAMSSTDDYKSLSDVLERAYQQAAHGKGRERHAQDQPFDQQPMQTISQLVGSSDGLRYQAIKKIQEAARMDKDAAIRELLGAINYIAGTIIYMEAAKPVELPTKSPTDEYVDPIEHYRGQWILRFSGVWSLIDQKAGTRRFSVLVRYTDGEQRCFETFNDVQWYGGKDIHSFQVL